MTAPEYAPLSSTAKREFTYLQEQPEFAHMNAEDLIEHCLRSVGEGHRDMGRVLAHFLREEEKQAKGQENATSV